MFQVIFLLNTSAVSVYPYSFPNANSKITLFFSVYNWKLISFLVDAQKGVCVAGGGEYRHPPPPSREKLTTGLFKETDCSRKMLEDRLQIKDNLLD